MVIDLEFMSGLLENEWAKMPKIMKKTNGYWLKLLNGVETISCYD